MIFAKESLLFLYITIHGNLTGILHALFKNYKEKEDSLIINLGPQIIRFLPSEVHQVEVVLKCNNEEFAKKEIKVENIQIRNL